jgi:hypothetical protein
LQHSELRKPFQVFVCFLFELIEHLSNWQYVSAFSRAAILLWEFTLLPRRWRISQSTRRWGIY